MVERVCGCYGETRVRYAVFGGIPLFWFFFVLLVTVIWEWIVRWKKSKEKEENIKKKKEKGGKRVCVTVCVLVSLF